MTDLAQRARDLVSRWEHGDEAHRQWLRDIATPDIEAAFREVRQEALIQAQRTASRFSMRPDRNLHPDIAWDNMNEATQVAAHSSAQQIAMEINELIDAPPQFPSFQQGVHDWLLACFGPEIAADKVERNHRFLEESLELVQACGCTQSEAHQLVDYVFGRPVGEIEQEIGGVMVTLSALCLAHGFDMMAAGDKEVRRVWAMAEKIRAKQAAKPKHSPLPESPPTITIRADVARALTGWFEAWWMRSAASFKTETAIEFGLIVPLGEERELRLTDTAMAALELAEKLK